MLSIKEEQELHMENVLSIRKKINQVQFQKQMIEIGQLINKLNAQKEGPIVTATYTVEQINSEQIMDVEILVPLNKEVELSGEYVFKKYVSLVNAVYIRHIGHPSKLQDTLQELSNYITSKQLIPITTTYNVQVKDVLNESEMDDMIIDSYVGINPNRL